MMKKKSVRSYSNVFRHNVGKRNFATQAESNDSPVLYRPVLTKPGTYKTERVADPPPPRYRNPAETESKEQTIFTGGQPPLWEKRPLRYATVSLTKRHFTCALSLRSVRLLPVYLPLCVEPPACDWRCRKKLTLTAVWLVRNIESLSYP
ncbi:hypothetical protein BaRGS_00023933 [Batillaria attramentaria]|uniref:Uncharacterized protein n=1 Tax=Batillaria attramentaria TaxID=370345 RepID=A0ABD0KCQ4_9CAEN